MNGDPICTNVMDLSCRGLYKPQPLEHTAVPQLRVREIPVARSNENVAQRLMAVSAASFEGAAEMLQCQTAMFAAFCVIVAIGLAVHCRSLGGVILSQGAEKT